jgi:hypothetical protein
MNPVGWASVHDVVTELGSPVLSTSDLESLRRSVDAANRYVAAARADLPYPWTPGLFDTYAQPAGTAVDADPRISLGVTMLAARWWQRRGSNDNTMVGEFGAFPTIDRDVEAILGVGRAYRPVIA